MDLVLALVVLMVLVVAREVSGRTLTVDQQFADKHFPHRQPATPLASRARFQETQVSISSKVLDFNNGETYDKTRGAVQVAATNVVRNGAANVQSSDPNALENGDLSKVGRECPVYQCPSDMGCPMTDGVCCGGKSGGKVNFCCPKGSACLTTDPPTCVHDAELDPFQCADEECRSSHHCPHDGVIMCCKGGDTCCKSGTQCKMTHTGQPVCEKMLAESERREYEKRQARLLKEQKAILLKEFAKHHNEVTFQNEETGKKMEADLLKQDMENKGTLSEKQSVLDRALAKDQEDEQKVKALQGKWQEEKLKARSQGTAQLREQAEKAANADEEKTKNFAQTSTNRVRAAEEQEKRLLEAAQKQSDEAGVKRAESASKALEQQVKKTEQTQKAADQARRDADEQAKKSAEQSEKQEQAKKKDDQQKVAEQAQKNEGIVFTRTTVPTRGQIVREAKDIEWTGSFTYMFWIKPTGINGQWSNVLHKGNSDGHRHPAVWFYPGSTRLHIRSGNAPGDNNGCDADINLPMGSWTHIAFSHSNQGVTVYHNGRVTCQTNYGGPARNDGPLYVSNPWYESARSVLADLRVVARVVSATEINEKRNQRQGLPNDEYISSEAANPEGLCTISTNCRGWENRGRAGIIVHVNDLGRCSLSLGGQFNSGWYWTHGDICCATSAQNKVAGLLAFSKNCPATERGLGGFIEANGDYGRQPFHGGGGFNGGWTWMHPRLCEMRDNTDLKKGSSSEPICLFGASCPMGWEDRGLAGLIMLNSHANHYNFAGFSRGGGFNGDWTWTHPRMCCMV